MVTFHSFSHTALLLRVKMVYDFQTREVLAELTLEATHTYIWSHSLESASSLCLELSASDEHQELLQWIDTLEADPRLDTIRACLLIFSVSDCWVIPQRFQLEAGLAAFWGKNTLVNAGTGSGKTLSMAIPLLMNLEAVAVVVSPLGRLHSTQAKELGRFRVKPLVMNEDSKLSRAQIKVHYIANLPCYLCQVSTCLSI